MASWSGISSVGRSLVQVKIMAWAVGWRSACHVVVIGRGSRSTGVLVVIGVAVAGTVARSRGARRDKHA